MTTTQKTFMLTVMATFNVPLGTDEDTIGADLKTDIEIGLQNLSDYPAQIKEISVVYVDVIPTAYDYDSDIVDKGEHWVYQDRYAIYRDGVIYDLERAADIPAEVFKVRDQLLLGMK
jgi:hypothetical protein